jgi:hypothetical protein
MDVDVNGQWLARHRPGSKRHLIESEIADRLVTRCGKQMKIMLGERGMHPFMDHAYCETCRGKDA